MNAKASYSGARAIVSTAQGGEMYVYTDGSFKYKTVPELLQETQLAQIHFTMEYNQMIQQIIGCLI